MKLCKDCRWHDSFGEFMSCEHPQNLKVQVTDGKLVLRWKYCNTNRLDGWLLAIINRDCGKRGRYWEPIAV